MIKTKFRGWGDQEDKMAHMLCLWMAQEFKLEHSVPLDITNMPVWLEWSHVFLFS